MRYPTLFLTLAAVCCEQKLKLEDWNGAADDFTKAIEADARLHAPKMQRKGVITGDAFDSLHAGSNEVSVSDSLTALAFTKRGAARLNDVHEEARIYRTGLRSGVVSLARRLLLAHLRNPALE